MRWQQDLDRQAGYRPCVGLLLVYSKCVLLGRKEDYWSCFWYENGGFTFQQKPEWMRSWDVPQGGIQPGESFGQAIRREVGEELGRDWAECISWPPRLFFRSQRDFYTRKDGRVWEGKTYYYHVVPLHDTPNIYADWVFGSKGDDCNPLPTPEFQGGVLFLNYAEASECIRRTQGRKAGMLLEVLGRLKEQRLIA